jgi:hypothetical protein
MNDQLQFILSLCIGFTVIIGVIRYTTIDKSYYPFFYLAAISLVIEIANFAFEQKGMNDAISAMLNIFDYVEFFFLTWLFHLWGLFNYKKNTFIFIIIISLVCWAILTFYVDSITGYNFYFPVVYTMTLLFFAVAAFNKFVIPDRKSMFKNPKFWILMGVIIFFAFYLLTLSTGFSIFGKKSSSSFRRALQDIVSYSNLVVNLMFAIGALWVPKKKNFTGLF